MVSVAPAESATAPVCTAPPRAEAASLEHAFLSNSAFMRTGSDNLVYASNFDRRPQKVISSAGGRRGRRTVFTMPVAASYLYDAL